MISEKEFNNRIETLHKILESCILCPRKCKVNRTKGEKGFCNSTDKLLVSSNGPHYGEEEPLVGSSGSGTIFLTNCNLGCVYCQNYDISHIGRGKIVRVEEFAEIMLSLQKTGCHNINFVTPTHFIPQIVKGIKIARESGLKIPLVYNCGGYENFEIIKLLDGFFDIYMPDIKYSGKETAKKYSNAPDYFERCRESVLGMYRQVGDLEIVDGIARKGLLIRHLVLPNNLAGSEEVLKFISEKLSKKSYVNIMDQYRPEYKANKFSELNRRPTIDEYNKVLELAKKFGLSRGFN